MKLTRTVFFVVALAPAVSAQQAEHVNPPIHCADSSAIGLYERGEGYPYPDKAYPQEPPVDQSVEALRAFCDRIRAEFASSGLAEGEANAVYDLLAGVLRIRDESFGMPSKDMPHPAPVSLRERAALRKRGHGVYGVYLWREGCGTTYSLLRATMSGSGDIEVEAEEVWRASYPC